MCMRSRDAGRRGSAVRRARDRRSRLYGGLVLAPEDYQQKDAFRMVYVHAPTRVAVAHDLHHHGRGRRRRASSGA